MEVLVMGRVHNAEAIRNKILGIPVEVKAEVFEGMMKINRDFIGDKKMAGLMRRKLYARNTWRNSKLWETRVVNLLKGKVVDPLGGQVLTRKSFFSAKKAGLGGGMFGAGISMRLLMGVMYRTKKKLDEALEFFETGGTVTSDKYMPIPVKGGDIGKAYTKFKYWLRAGKFTVIYKNGLAFYFLRNGPRSRDDLKFVGRKNVNIKFKLQMKQNFAMNESKMQKRLADSIDAATRRLNAI
jgi:hypothetical protein